MDDVLIGAIEVLSDPSDIRPFFTIVKEVHDEHNSDFDDFKEALLADTNGYAEQKQALVEYADNNQRLDLISQLSDLGPDQLYTEYDAYLEEAEQAESEDAEDSTDDAEDEEPVQDEAAQREGFIEFLKQFNAYWTGTDESWDEFVGHTWDYAVENFPELAQDFFGWAADADNDGKLALFAEFDITVTLDEESAEGTDDAGDEAGEDALWATAVEAYGPAWAEWDGTEEGWEQYRDWFYDATNTDSPESYAVAYEKLDPLNGMELAQRIATMKDFGFTITAVVPEDAGDGGDAGDEAAAQPTAEDIQQATEVLAGAVDALPDADQQLVTPALLKDVLEAEPELATLSAEDLKLVMQEVAAARAEMQAS